MADQIKKLSAGHSIEVLDAIMTEVEEARGEYESLDARLDEISGEGYSKAEVDALLAEKQNVIDNAHKLSADFVDDTNTTHKFATAVQLAQIATNENNISKDEAALVELVDSGAKNFINVGFTSKAATATSPSVINNNDGSITLNGSNTGNNPIIVRDICSDLTASQDTRYTLPTGVFELCGTGNEDVLLQVYNNITGCVSMRDPSICTI